MYIRNFDPEWSYTIGKDGGINSYHNTTYDGHGGYSVQHHMEMEEIANAVLDKRLQELSNAIERRHITAHRLICWTRCNTMLKAWYK